MVSSNTLAPLAQSGQRLSSFGRVDARIESSRSHEVHRVVAATDIGVGIDDATDAIREGPNRRAAVRAKAFQAVLQTNRVDAHCRGILRH